MQTQLTLTTDSPINTDKLSGQNGDIFKHLVKGNHITRYEAEKLYGIGNLHSRISDLKNKFKIAIESKMIKVLDFFGRETYVKEYWINENGLSEYLRIMNDPYKQI